MNNETENRSNVLAMLVQVAQMYYEGNLSQQQIADELGVSRSLIAQYLKRARDQGIVKIEINNPQDYREDLALILQSRTSLNRVVVVPSTGNSAALTRRSIAGALARHLEKTLQDGDVVGIGFGRTMAEVAELLAPSRNCSADFLPLVGESSSGLIGTYSQVNLHVLKMASSFSGTPHFLHAPLMVHSPALRNLLLDDEVIHSVTRYWDRLTHVCVGIGTLPPVTGEIIYIGRENLAEFENAGGVGDVCSRYFSAEGQFIESPLYERVIGIHPRQLHQSKHVLAVASGHEKAQATAALLRAGLITDLFVDEDLARAILAELPNGS
ncbi:MAG: sugar-binding domain-containing protein [Anaerolineales bacterium]